MKVNTQKVGAMWTEVSAKFSDPFQKPQNIQRMECIVEANENMEESSKYYWLFLQSKQIRYDKR